MPVEERLTFTRAQAAQTHVRITARRRRVAGKGDARKLVECVGHAKSALARNIIARDALTGQRVAATWTRHAVPDLIAAFVGRQGNMNRLRVYPGGSEHDRCCAISARHCGDPIAPDHSCGNDECAAPAARRRGNSGTVERLNL
jgi:hypothetical protein